MADLTRLPAPAPRSRRTIAWVVLVAATLALKAFVPLLAAFSAQLQDRAVAEVCTVYGVRLAVTGEPSLPEPAGHATHGSDPCALSGLAAGAAGGSAPAMADAFAREPGRGAPVSGTALPHDASTRWLAMRLHAPPAPA